MEEGRAHCGSRGSSPFGGRGSRRRGYCMFVGLGGDMAPRFEGAVVCRVCGMARGYGSAKARWELLVVDFHKRLMYIDYVNMTMHQRRSIFNIHRF